MNRSPWNRKMKKRNLGNSMNAEWGFLLPRATIILLLIIMGVAEVLLS